MQKAHWFSPKTAVLLLVASIIGLLSLANLDRYPPISGWDEGIYLQFGRNLIRYGEYGTLNGDTFERLIPPGGTGPTVIIPVGLAVLLGPGDLIAARSVMAAYLLIAVAGAYLLVHRVGGWAAASVGVLFYIVAGHGTYDMLWAGRQVLAEAAAFAFGSLGTFAWIKSWGGGRWWLAACGVLIGLAVISKNQLLWLYVPGFALITAADRLYYRQLSWRYAAVPIFGALAGYILWYLVSLWIVGPSERMRYIEALGALTRATYLHTSPERWLLNVRLFISHSQSWIVGFGIVYSFYTSRHRSLGGLARLVLPAFASVSVIGFLLLATPFPRYLLAPLSLGMLCCALFVDGFAAEATRRLALAPIWRVLIVGLLVAALAGPRLIRNANRIISTNDTSAERFAEFLDQTVPGGSSVMNWEWEIEFYSRSRFVHPPYELFPAHLDTLNGHHHPILRHCHIGPEVEYVVVGPFGAWVFERELQQRPHRLLIAVGPYRLYWMV